MHLSAHKEQFSLAYVRAVAAASGHAVYTPSVDNDSVDIGIASRRAGHTCSPRLELQVKCTAGPPAVRHIGFELKKKNYDDLRHTNLLVPRILVVVVVPENVHDWVEYNEEGLVLRRCGYWVSLLGHPAAISTTSVTIRIPRLQLFHPPTLHDLINMIAEGRRP